MKHRYQSWVEDSTSDWNISRQRFFGVPFPLWYPTDANNDIDFDSPILADLADLPVDPSSDVPAGFGDSQRNQPNGFVGDPDVMDTWATSSLSPLIAGHWAPTCSSGSFLWTFAPRPTRSSGPGCSPRSCAVTSS